MSWLLLLKCVNENALEKQTLHLQLSNANMVKNEINNFYKTINFSAQLKLQQENQSINNLYYWNKNTITPVINIL